MEEVSLLDVTSQVPTGFHNIGMQSGPADNLGESPGILLSMDEELSTSLKTKNQYPVRINSLKKLEGNSNSHIR